MRRFPSFLFSGERIGKKTKFLSKIKIGKKHFDKNGKKKENKSR